MALDGKNYMNWRIGLLLQYKYTENVPTYQRALAFREMGTIDMLALALNDFDHALTEASLAQSLRLLPEAKSFIEDFDSRVTNQAQQSC